MYRDSAAFLTKYIKVSIYFIYKKLYKCPLQSRECGKLLQLDINMEDWRGKPYFTFIQERFCEEYGGS